MTKPKTKEVINLYALTKSQIKDKYKHYFNKGYAQALADVEKTFNIGKPFMISSETLFQRIQALKEQNGK